MSTILKSGSLNLLESSALARPVQGFLYLHLLLLMHIMQIQQLEMYYFNISESYNIFNYFVFCCILCAVIMFFLHDHFY